MTTPQFNTGIAAMEKAYTDGQKRQEAAKAAAEGAGNKIKYISWKPGDTKIVRFLTDELVTEKFAEFIMDSTGSTKNFMIPPNDPGILDRYRSPYPGIGWKQDYKTKKLVEPRLREVGCGIAVLREQKLNPETGKLDVEDYLYEQEIEGVNYLTRHFGIIQQSIPNFWLTLIMSCMKLYGTICDRDYMVTRTGESIDTKYSIIPLNPDPDLDSLEKTQQFYFYGAAYDKEDPQRYLKCNTTLIDWATYFSGEERYKFWLTPGYGASAPKTAQGQGQQYQQPSMLPGQQNSPMPTYTPPPAPSPQPVAEQPIVQPVPAGPISGDPGADEAQAGPAPTPAPAPQPTAPPSTNFANFKEDIIAQAKAQAAQG